MNEIHDKMNFEQAYAALRETVAALENPDTTIDESLALYEKACKLVVLCQRKLNEARDKVVDINTRVKELRVSGAPLFEEEV